jgi:histidinol phosphatase-like enzyme
MILFDKGIWLKQEENVHLSERVVIQYRERDVQAGKNVKVYFKRGWNKSPFDINSVVFHFDDLNYGRRITTIFF